MLYTLPDSIFMNISKKTAVPMSLLEFTEVFIFQASVYKTKITIFANGNPQNTVTLLMPEQSTVNPISTVTGTGLIHIFYA